MYFLAHMFSILNVLPEGLPLEEVIKPMIVGSWSPDAGYFQLFSPKLKIFDHQEIPPLLFYNKESQRGKAYALGWKLHLLCDELIHENPFFLDNGPLCPKIIKGEGVRRYFSTAKIHLGREAGLDLFIYENLLKNDSKTNFLWIKDFYKKPVVSFPGFQKIQNYVYWYVNRFLPLINNNSKFSRRIKKTIDYGFYKNEDNKIKTGILLTKAQKECKKLIDKELIL